MKKEFKVEVVSESAFSTLILGSAKMPIKKIESTMNTNGLQGWDVVFQIVESRRLFLFWQREALVITFSRDLKEQQDKGIN